MSYLPVRAGITFREEKIKISTIVTALPTKKGGRRDSSDRTITKRERKRERCKKHYHKEL